jgi:hypothetical protein
LAYDLHNRLYQPNKGKKRQNIGFTGDTAVVTPISNDKITPSDSASSSVTDRKKADQSTLTQKDVGSEAISHNGGSAETNSVDIERASQIYHSSEYRVSSEGTITNQEQAQAVAAEIRSQIEANGLQSLKAMTGAISSSDSLAAILEAAPA